MAAAKTLTKEQLVERARRAGLASAKPSVRIEAAITMLVNRAPALTDEQKSRLASILGPSSGGTA